MSKYKLKSSKSILKRFKITATGKLVRHRACRSHLLCKKTSQHKQKLRKAVVVKYVDAISLRPKII
jgi:large subunit ribosomal protein L35